MTQHTAYPDGTASAKWLRTGEVARKLGLSETRVRALADNGTLEVQLTSLGRLFSAESVERYVLRLASQGGRTKTRNDAEPRCLSFRKSRATGFLTDGAAKLLQPLYPLAANC